MKVQMKTLTPVSDKIQHGEGNTTYIPIKWDFLLLVRNDDTVFHSFESAGPLGVIQMKNSLFISFEAYQTYLNFY